MVIIDDLEKSESEIVVKFLHDSIYDEDLSLSITDCISVAKEIKFHKYKSEHANFVYNRCKICHKLDEDTIHKVEYQEFS